jgi:hypothetical protein
MPTALEGALSTSTPDKPDTWPLSATNDVSHDAVIIRDRRLDILGAYRYAIERRFSYLFQTFGTKGAGEHGLRMRRAHMFQLSPQMRFHVISDSTTDYHCRFPFLPSSRLARASISDFFDADMRPLFTACDEYAFAAMARLRETITAAMPRPKLLS